MTKRSRKSGAEQDATSRWAKKYLCYLQRAGVRSGIKREMRRRERHDSKKEQHIDQD